MAVSYEWLRRWVLEGETGLSSLTIAAMLGPPGITIRPQDRGVSPPSAPVDAFDVRRCTILLDLAAEAGHDWRSRLPELASLCPAWGPIASVWPAIETLSRVEIEAIRDHAERQSRSPGFLHTDRGQIVGFSSGKLKPPSRPCSELLDLLLRGAW